MLSALRGDGIVLAQREVDAKSNEITAFRPLLDPLDLADAVLSFDALLNQTDHVPTEVERSPGQTTQIQGFRPRTPSSRRRVEESSQ
ncbi:hypothetical protein ACWGBX_16110 [Streptomyces sp. NPDC055037]